MRQDASGWSPSGIIDFEPAMLGAPEYDFASVGIFLTCTRLLTRDARRYRTYFPRLVLIAP